MVNRVDDRQNPRPRTVWKTSENDFFFKKTKNAPAHVVSRMKAHGNSKFMMLDRGKSWHAKKWAHKQRQTCESVNALCVFGIEKRCDHQKSRL